MSKYLGCQAYLEEIEKERRFRGMSVAELARRIGVDRKRLWYMLNGQREMRVDEFLKICIALSVDPRRFITRDMIDGVYERIYKKKS